MTDRRRNTLILLIVAALVAASGVAIALKPTFLGLELKGGLELTYEARPTAAATVSEENLNRSIEIMRKRVDALGVAQPEIQRSGGNQINVALPDVTNVHRAEEEVGKTAQLEFYDWEPNVIGPNGRPLGNSFSISESSEITGGSNAGASTSGLTQYQAILRAEKRPPELRHDETTLTPGCTLVKSERQGGCLYGSWYLIEPKHEQVLCPGKQKVCAPVARKRELFADHYHPPKGDTVKAVHINPGTILLQARPVENAEGNKVVDASPNSFYVLRDDPVLNGSDIKNPQEISESGATGNGQPVVSFGFNGRGVKVFERVTREIAERGQNAQLPGVTAQEAQQHFAIALDEQLITVPYINFVENPTGIDASNGSQISGGFTITSAQNLAQELQSGSLPVKLVQISNSQVSGTLGKQALREAITAGLLGFILVCVFLIAFYRVLGLIAVGGLLIYGAYFYALIKLIPITMTLPGIAGIVITIGVCADANIVIFERVKEEIRSGRSIISGIATGYKRGFAAIIDANVVTFMTAFILFALATAEVKGFAFTLGIGTLVSLFTAVLATQAALGTMGRSRLVSSPAMLGAGKPKRRLGFNFMGASRWFFTLSGVILLIGALAIGGRGLNFGIDFKSGTRIQVGFAHPPAQSKVQSVMSQLGFPEAEIQALRHNKTIGGNGYQITTQTLHPGKIDEVRSTFERDFAGPAQNGVRAFNENSVGPTFGKTVANSAIIAIIASLIVISAYIALRFEWKYAVPVLIALMHDILITSGVYALTGREVTTATVAALLTILGYSLYDTIIVFDRVRENVPRMPRAAFSQIVNRSMSEVLTRSIATSLCTLLPVISLLILGGETLKDFAFALLVGIASGAYSSIFIASPVLTHWKEREPVYRHRRERIEAELGAVPAYAAGPAGAPVDEEPVQQRRRRRGPGLGGGSEPGEQISKQEFAELVEDLDVERESPSRGQAGRPSRAQAGGRTATRPPRRARPGGDVEAPPPAAGQQEPEQGPEPSRDPAADLEPDEVVMPRQPRRGGSGSRQRRNRRHGRSH